STATTPTKPTSSVSTQSAQAQAPRASASIPPRTSAHNLKPATNRHYPPSTPYRARVMTSVPAPSAAAGMSIVSCSLASAVWGLPATAYSTRSVLVSPKLGSPSSSLSAVIESLLSFSLLSTISSTSNHLTGTP